MVINIFVDIEPSKCIQCVCESQGPWNQFIAKDWKKM